MDYRDDDIMTRDRPGYSSSRDRDRGGMFDYRNRDEDRGRYEPESYAYRDRDRRFGRSRHGSHDLIASDRVEGTAVYGREGDKLGSIHNFMVEKRGGRVAYAVMKRASGFLGMDERYYPLKWSELDYDVDQDGYCVDMTEDDLDHRRSFDSRGRPVNERSDYDRD